jgi:hypothetical protein
LNPFIPFFSYDQTWINCGYNSNASTLKGSPFYEKLYLPYETDVKHLQVRAQDNVVKTFDPTLSCNFVDVNELMSIHFLRMKFFYIHVCKINLFIIPFVAEACLY